MQKCVVRPACWGRMKCPGNLLALNRCCLPCAGDLQKHKLWDAGKPSKETTRYGRLRTQLRLINKVDEPLASIYLLVVDVKVQTEVTTPYHRATAVMFASKPEATP